MANQQPSWYSGLTELTIVPGEYYYIVRMISFFFITLAIALILPVLALVVYDFALWIWRLASSKPTPVTPASTRASEVVEGQKPAIHGVAEEEYGQNTTT
ncbi:hypothetical protein QBC33DRAFT_554999 [Phialemonium atrogriseum]|uniref:Uncharacterized protein n=1 Tax=Phialemonium atrogriseum TaxID=1093897 RepID=A0AAJ0FL62_9PEZI|nr:uncharacterized protein QBC33DRAFT_554999 [Phialemonium atrogriseum]KAK1771837.1 hypothetical protein QBC33DRAFT_554999 [Phialemonium atrogriseum]